MWPLNPNYWQSAGPRTAKNIFEYLSKAELSREFFEILILTPELREYLLRYLWILREESLIQSILKNPDLPNEVAFEFIQYGLLQIDKGAIEETGAQISKITNLLHPETCVRLLSFPEVKVNQTLTIHLIANLDAKSWDYFFSNLEVGEAGLEDIAGLFNQLEWDELRKLFYRNNTFYASIRMIFLLMKDSNILDLNLTDKIELLLDYIQTLEDLVKNLKESFSMEEERALAPRDRNCNRLSIIVHELSQMNPEDRGLVLDFFLQKDLVLDSDEHKMLGYMINNYSKERVLEF